MNAPERGLFRLDSLDLESGARADGFSIAWTTWGQLNPAGDNAILFMTPFTASGQDIAWMVGPGRALDPDRYFIVVPELFGNGRSSSPSNIRGAWPDVTIADNVHGQHRLLRECFGIRRLRMACGWSMGGLQAYHWAVLYPDMAEQIAVLCASARTSAHNYVFLDSVRAALLSDTAWHESGLAAYPDSGMRAVGRIFAAWAMSPDFYRDELWRELGYGKLEDYLRQEWEPNFLSRSPLDLLSHVWTWQQADIAGWGRRFPDLHGALAAIRAHVLLMPGVSDQFFRMEDNARELGALRSARLCPIPSPWGHRAGMNAQCTRDSAFVDRGLRAFLAGGWPEGAP